MLKIIIIVLVCLFTISFDTANSVTIPNTVLEGQKKPITTPNDIEMMITHYANKYGVDRAEIVRIMDCENRSRIPDLQSYHTYKTDRPEWGVKAGEREKSFGLVQIHLPTDPSVSYEEAIDPDFSINYLASELSKGKGHRWSCY